jgi:hypothetical protein
MTLHLVTPAPMVAVLDLYAEQTPMKPVNAAAARLQAARSEGFALYAGDDLIAAALLYPLRPERWFCIDGCEQPVAERLVELAFVCRPDLAPHTLSLIRHAHLTRARLLQSGPVRVRAHVHSDHLPGKRLARLCGMALVGRFGIFERYEAEGSPDGTVCRGSQVALHGA